MNKVRPAGVTSSDIARSNLAVFKAWVAQKSDADFRDMVVRGGLSRLNVADECGFTKSVLTQNKLVARALRELEDELRARGILPKRVESAKTGSCMVVVKKSSASALLLERLSRLEQENAALRAEARELRSQLGKFVVIREVLESTGRIPR